MASLHMPGSNYHTTPYFYKLHLYDLYFICYVCMVFLCFTGLPFSYFYAQAVQEDEGLITEDNSLECKKMDSDDSSSQDDQDIE